MYNERRNRKGGQFMNATTIKSTININKYYKEQMEYLVKINKISSVTEGINIAIEQYIKEKQKEIYAMEMEKAKSDPEFIKRTIGVQKEFEKSDSDIEKLISEENYEW